MLIRDARQGDEDAVVAVFAEARSTMAYLPSLHTEVETRRYFRALLDEHPALLAVLDERVLGFAAFGDGWLHHLYVKERRQGVGTRLLQSVMRRSPGGLQLWTFQANHGARRFYERHGFLAVEVTDGSANEERLPDVRYHWAGAPAA